ncbi:glycosyltransferase family 4 protein [Rhodopila sp.]|uniref:glycosyltransferase family 4 protein n=1 Tax=Rhodopila sp. TaxID=2480087 RepID=UPI003D114769
MHKPYGFGRFVFELCHALGSAPSDIEYIVAVPSRIDVNGLPKLCNITWYRVADANFAWWEQRVIPELAKRLRCGVIHFPYNTRSVFAGSIPTVTTVHDLIFLSETFPLRLRWIKARLASMYVKFGFRFATPRSRTIISISRTTQQLLAHRGIPSEMVYNSIDGFLSLGPSTSRGRPGPPYLLHRGGHLPYRNTGRVIEAFRRARKEFNLVADLKIIGVPDGADRWGRDATIHYLQRISDNELATLYAESACVVSASLQEGFGLPIIEGFGFGTPVIASDLDPMREIAGDAALLVNPYDIEAITRAMVAVLTDPGLAETLVQKGRDRMAVFAGKQVAEKMTNHYAAAFNGI